MIAASDPVEFFPRGRQAVEEHPGPIFTKQQLNIHNDHMLLYRMKNVNISNDDYTEFWSVRELYDECRVKSFDGEINFLESHTYMSNCYINSEEELYVKKNTAVWSKGLQANQTDLPRMCFTCDTPIQFAFFCDDSFVATKKIKSVINPEVNEKLKKKNTTICMIDATSLRVYCSNGEDYVMRLEFPVSNVWPTKFGILLEKEASSSIIQSHSISLPRIFSLCHPLEEICPIIYKSASGIVSYISESDYRVIFTTNEYDLVLLYDNKIGKHFVAKYRKASDEEINYVGCKNEINSSTINISNPRASCSFSQNSLKLSNVQKNSTAILARSSLGGNSGHTTHIDKFLNATNNSPSINSPIHNLSHSNVQSPLTRFQSSLGGHTMSIKDIRKIGQAEPSKPIKPEFCLEHIWTESITGKDFCEIAVTAFIHTDLVGQKFLCYLLSRSCKLQMIRLEVDDNKIKSVYGKLCTISAKDAIVLPAMKMIVVLVPCGSLILYSGTIMISKVHVGGNLSVTTTQSNSPFSPFSPFPRRSSLLPNSQQSDTKFGDDLHVLSPVHPLPQQFPSRNLSGACIGLRDPAGNRLSLCFPNGKIFRISLPLINETNFVTKCICALRQVLTREIFILFISRWYGARNPPGSQDFSIEQEWDIFSKILSEMIGRSIVLNESNASTSFSAEPKRRKNDEVVSGTNEHWNYLNNILSNTKADSLTNTKVIKYNDPTALLFQKIPLIFYTFHLMYEDMKLDKLEKTNLPLLAEFLYQLASDIQLDQYCLHYFLDYPRLKIRPRNLFTEEDGLKMQHKNLLTGCVPNIFRQIENILRGKEIYKYSCIRKVNTMSRNVIQLVSLIAHGHSKLKDWIKDVQFPGTESADSPNRPNRMISMSVPRSEQVIEMLINMGMTRIDVESLPTSIHLIVAQSLEYSRLNPPIGRSSETYELILRSELVQHSISSSNKASLNSKFDKFNLDLEDSLSPRNPLTPNGLLQRVISEQNDGMETIDSKLLSLRFPDDLRIIEVRRLLNSSEPVNIDVSQIPGVSDHEFIEEQEKQLFALCTRTMTLPMGRGMLTMRTVIPSPTISLPIPKLCLTGKEPIKGATIEMQQIEFPANMNLWPTFHNGVAAGLKISSNASDVDSTWIVFNKPKQGADISTEHAGFLMALGLNGHIKLLSFMSIYEYLVKCEEMTSVGLLLGISANSRGSMDTKITKLLSVHIEALLPATALELDIPQNIQVAALMGIGLLYQGSAKRHIAEVLLQEIGRPPGPEMENSIERESYALTAGLALGLVTLGQGESPAGLRDLQLPDTLHYYMVGGNKRPLTGSQKEKYKLPSFQVREGDTVNIDVTAPGATLALGLMFFNTGNKAVAEWMKPPDTSYLLDLIRPDLLLLRIIARGLILWADIEPTTEWLYDQFPSKLKFDIKRGPGCNVSNIDHEANAQAYCNIIAGAAFCIGLKYAGTENPDAFKALRYTITTFLSMHGLYVGEYAGKVTVENSLVLTLISISLVYAGTGNLEILKIIRYLRSRIGPSHSQVTYGSHMGIHMSLGFLFLGAGRYTISKTPEAVAALVCSLFPKFPNHSNDNRYHLQALRHMYVLATEPRLFLPRDIDTKKLCLCQVSYIKLNSTEVHKLPTAPYMLPDLNTLQSVIVDDPNYWPVSFERGRNWNQLENVLKNCGCIDIKKRAGCLSHLDDPGRLKSLFARTLTTEQYNCWKCDPKALFSFSNDPNVVVFLKKFLNINNIFEYSTKSELFLTEHLTIMFYNCLTKDKLHALSIYLKLLDHLQMVQNNKTPLNSYIVWQFKIIETYMTTNKDTQHLLISKELIISLIEMFKKLVEQGQLICKDKLKHFITSSRIDVLNENSLHLDKVIANIIYFEIIPNILNLVDLSGKVNYIRMLYELKKLKVPTSTINSVTKLLALS